MPATLFQKHIDLDLYYPPFLERLLKLKAQLQERGMIIKSTEGHRSYQRSDELHKAYLLNGGPKAAPGGFSAHNFGLADDGALIVDGRAVWDEARFVPYGLAAEALGLDWGGRYRDSPHIGWPGFVNAKQLEPLRKIWEGGEGLELKPRLRLCWDYVDTHSPSPLVKP